MFHTNMASPQLRPSIPRNITSSDVLHKRRLSNALKGTLDRVNVLGDDSTHGHTGCVNALSWARDGELLLSGGDDTTVRVWRLDQTNSSQEYPYACCAVISTGHRANIFGTSMLPHSSRIATVAGDKQVRIFDIGESFNFNADGGETDYNSRNSRLRILKCHSDRVKRIITEDSPDSFLTVSEDGTVRQHDLRTRHDCSEGRCPPPLIQVNHDLSTMALSPLTPYQIVVAGASPYAYLFDRRHSGRIIREEWGEVPRQTDNEMTTCVRRFGKPLQKVGNSRFRQDHITGARMASSNGHEVLLSHSGDAVYLYSTHDDPDVKDSMAPTTTSRIPSNSDKNSPRPSEDAATASYSERAKAASPIITRSENNEQGDGDSHLDTDDDSSSGDGESDDEDGMLSPHQPEFYPLVPVIRPQRRYFGARNVATVKDVNFLGPSDEFVVSGSDDGNFFIWRKSDAALHGIYEGDGSVVNVVEGHPHFPLLAVSGIDTTIKLFGLTSRPSVFSRMDNAERIIETNTRLSKPRGLGHEFALLLAHARAAAAGADNEIPECTYQ